MAGKDLTITLTAKDGTSTVFKQVGTEAERMGQKVTTASDKSSASLTRMGGNAKLLGAAMGIGVGVAVKAASDLNESTDKAARTFGRNFAEIQRFAEDAAQSMGLSSREALDAVSAFGLMFQSAGATGDELTKMSESTTQLAADLGSLYNVSSADAQQALISGLVGESEPLRQFNIFLSETAVNQELVAEGAQKVGGQYTEQQKIMARYNLILQQGATASGNFIETSDGLANSTKIAHAEIMNAAEALGSAFLPAAIAAAHGVSDLAGAFANLPQGAQTAIGDVIMGAGGIAALTIGAVKVRELTQDMRELAIAAKATQIGTAITSPLGLLTVGAGLAGLAIYELAKHHDDLAGAADRASHREAELTGTLADLADELKRVNLLQQAVNAEDFLTSIEQGAEQREADLQAVNSEIEAFAGFVGGANEATIRWANGQAILVNATGDVLNLLSDRTTDVLQYIGALDDGVITSQEMAAAQTFMAGNFEGTKDTIDAYNAAWQETIKLAADYRYDGAAIIANISAIDKAVSTGQITEEQGIALLKAVSDDRAHYNITLNESTDATEANTTATADLTETLYGGATAVGQVQGLLARFNQENRSGAEAAFTATHNINLENDAIDEMTRGFAAAGTGIDIFAKGQAAAAAQTVNYTAQIHDLNAELTDTGAEGLDRYMGMIVGFTDGIVDSTSKAKKWADNLIAPVGVYSELDNLLANGKITLDQYNAAQQAQIDITNDDARAQAARNQIQAEQAPLIAQQSDAAADYIEKLAGMTAGEQELALAYADPAQAKRITDIADMAAGYHDMTDAQKEAFGETVTSAAAADSSLAAVLQSLGIIKASTTDPTGWEINMDTVNSQTAMDTLVSTLQDLVNILAQVYNLDITTSFDTSGFWSAYLALPDSKTIDVYTHNGGSYGPTPGVGAIGGTFNFATGGMVHLAEIGPEMLRYPSGAIGMAYNEGNYMVPSGTHVDTANATASTLSARGNGKPSLHLQGCTFYITPATPDLHDAIASTVLRGGL